MIFRIIQLVYPTKIANPSNCPQRFFAFITLIARFMEPTWEPGGPHGGPNFIKSDLWLRRQDISSDDIDYVE